MFRRAFTFSQRYILLPALTCTLATAVTLAFWQPIFHWIPFALYFAAVAISARFSCWLAGFSVALAGALIINTNHGFSHELLGPTAVLLIVCGFISYLSVGERAARADAERFSREAAESERLSRLMIENVRDYAIFLTDRDGNVTRWNIGAQRVLGWSESEIMGKPASIIFLPEDLARGDHLREMETAAREGHASDDRWHRRKDGSLLFVNGMMMRVDDQAGHHIGFTKVLRDVTARRQSEEALQNALADAERANRMKDEFLATLSHELRTPLTAILGWSQILMNPQDGQDPQELAEGLRIIHRNANAQTQIIEDLLDMSRIISGKVRLETRPLEIAPVIRAAIETVQHAADAKSIHIESDFESIAAPVTGDSSRLQQIFWNLLSNAVKFTPRDGTVRVSLHRVESHIQIVVADTGQGISAEFLPHVFDRFRQADSTSTRHHGGLGLGLAIVKQLLELHGGTIRAESPGPNQGSSFIVTLPLIPILPDSASETSSPSDPIPPTRVLDSLKILVVDDETDARDMVRHVLQRAGAQTICASSAQEAFSSLQSARPDVLVSDIGMPGEDGYSLIHRIRALPGEQGGNTPSIALTAYARPEDRARCLSAGFQVHISKPVQPDVLIAVVADLTGRRS